MPVGTNRLPPACGATCRPVAWPNDTQGVVVVLGGAGLVDLERARGRRRVDDHARRGRALRQLAQGHAAEHGRRLGLGPAGPGPVLAGKGVSDRARPHRARGWRACAGRGGDRAAARRLHFYARPVAALVRGAAGICRSLAAKRVEQFVPELADRRRRARAGLRRPRAPSRAAGGATGIATGRCAPVGAVVAAEPAFPVQCTQLDCRTGAP